MFSVSETVAALQTQLAGPGCLCIEAFVSLTLDESASGGTLSIFHYVELSKTGSFPKT